MHLETPEGVNSPRNSNINFRVPKIVLFVFYRKFNIFLNYKNNQFCFLHLWKRKFHMPSVANSNLVGRIDCIVRHYWKVLLVTFLFNILNMNLKILATIAVLVSVSVGDVDIAILAQRVQQEVAFSHSKPELIAWTLRAEAEQDKREQSHH